MIRFDVVVLDLFLGECGIGLASTLGKPMVGYWGMTPSGMWMDYTGMVVGWWSKMCRILKIRNCETRFLLPFYMKGGMVNRKLIPFFIHFMILLANDFGIDSRKKCQKW